MSKDKSIVKVQEMMHRMHIDHDTYASSRPVLPMIFENQSLKSPSHHHHQQQQQQQQQQQKEQQQQQQHRERSRFFYKLRQKKKRRHLGEKIRSSIARKIRVKQFEKEAYNLGLSFKPGCNGAAARASVQSTDVALSTDFRNYHSNIPIRPLMLINI